MLEPPKVVAKRRETLVWDERAMEWIPGVDRDVSIAHRPKSFESSVAVAGTPNIHNVAAALGQHGHDGYVINDDSANDLYVYVSNDGENFNGGMDTGSTEKITIKAGEGLPLTAMNVHTLKIDASANTTSYRVMVY